MVSRVGPNLFKPGGSESSEMPFDRICLDAGHGMSNRTPGVFDPGAVAGGVREMIIRKGRKWCGESTGRRRRDACNFLILNQV